MLIQEHEIVGNLLLVHECN